MPGEAWLLEKPGRLFMSDDTVERAVDEDVESASISCVRGEIEVDALCWALLVPPWLRWTEDWPNSDCALSADGIEAMVEMVMGQLPNFRVIPAVTLWAPGVAFEARRCFFRSFGSDCPEYRLEFLILLEIGTLGRPRRPDQRRASDFVL